MNLTDHGELNIYFFISNCFGMPNIVTIFLGAIRSENKVLSVFFESAVF